MGCWQGLCRISLVSDEGEGESDDETLILVLFFFYFAPSSKDKALAKCR